MYWKKWAAKHEQEELNEGVLLEPALALLQKKAKGVWTEKHRIVARKILLEGGWTHKRLFDIGWSDTSHAGEGPEKHRLYHCSEWHEIRRDIPEPFRKSKKEWKWQRGIVAHLLNESQWNRSYFSMKKLESEKHKSWSMPAEGFKGHVATDGSLPGKAGKWKACCWAVVRLDYDEEMGPCM